VASGEYSPLFPFVQNFKKNGIILLDYSICKNAYAETTKKGRTYFTPDGDFSSVTTILGATANNQWLEAWKQKVGEEEAARISKLATDRGELVHEYLERYWNGDDVFPTLSKETSDVVKMTTNLINATVKNVTDVRAQEIALWNSQLGYAGRVDMVAEWRGVLSVIDFKTSKKKKYKRDVTDYYIQCAAYAEAHNLMFGTNIEKLVILITTETGIVQGFYGNRVHYLPELKYRVNQFRRLHGK